MRPHLKILLIIFLTALPHKGNAALCVLSPCVQINNVLDVSLPNWNMGDPAVSSSTDMCIGSLLASPAGGYTVNASSPGGFNLSDGAGHNIAYQLYWEDSGTGNLGTTLGTQLNNNVTLSGRLHGNLVNALCLLGNNARLTIKITQAAMQAALSGTYNGAITLLISIP